MKIRDCILIEAFKCNELETIVDVAKKLREITLRHIFVVDKNDYPIGVISITDINNRVVAEGLDPKKVKAKDIMSKPIDIVDINEDVKAVFERHKGKHHVIDPVVKDKKMIGIITLHQIIKNIK